MFLLKKKTSWILLIPLFIFDNIVSYLAIKYWNGREANLLIAPIVEKYPLVYFLCIPAEILIILAIVWIVKKVAGRLLIKWNFSNEILERVILQLAVIYWAVANSSPNLIFLLGFRLPGIWLITSILGICITLIYIFMALDSKRKK